jgi:hypothetical protein
LNDHFLNAEFRQECGFLSAEFHRVCGFLCDEDHLYS